MSPALVVVLAYILDQIFGDPHFRLHPVRLLGDVAEFWRRFFYAWGKLGGLLTLSFTLVVVVGSVSLITHVLPWTEPLWLYFFIAEKALRTEAVKVYQSLAQGELSLARKQLSFIVGRETKELSESECIRAAVETVAENFSDGFVGPLFYYLVGGIPLATAYKVVETLDSMYGYRTEKWRSFGFFPARADDFLNFLPARLAGLLLVAAAALHQKAPLRAFKVMLRDARKHDSPNAGWPEAAVAGALGISLGGPLVYHGKAFDKPRLGDPLRPRRVEDIKEAVALLRLAAFLGVLFTTLGEVVLWKLGCPHLIDVLKKRPKDT